MTAGCVARSKPHQAIFPAEANVAAAGQGCNEYGAGRDDLGDRNAAIAPVQ
jgi:hypothetical protein